MQKASIISPLNWSLNGFYDILLRGSGVSGISGHFAALMIFFVATFTLAVLIGIKNRER
jgi:ABC-2 type transport system permease protein